MLGWPTPGALAVQLLAGRTSGLSASTCVCARVRMRAFSHPYPRPQLSLAAPPPSRRRPTAAQVVEGVKAQLLALRQPLMQQPKST